MLSDVPLYFADQDWKRPDRARYMGLLAKHRPVLATVLDWEQPEQLPEVMSWALEAAQHISEAVLIVAKVPGGVGDLPETIGGKEVRIAYSVPTSYGGSPLGLWELRGRSVHLLGGSPQKQVDVWRYLREICEVRSVDGNMAKKMATSRCCYWTDIKSYRGHWLTLRGFYGNGPNECVKRSCEAIVAFWRSLYVCGCDCPATTPLPAERLRGT